MFALHGFVPGAYALFAFVLGATAGVLFRRTFPAMAVTLAGFIAARLLVTYELRPNLLPQTTKSFPLSPATFGIQINSPSVSIVPQPPDLPNAWVLSTSIVNAKGQSPTQSFINSACSGLPGVNGAPLPAPWGGHRTAVSASASARDALQHCMTSVAASYHVVVRYQAANHFWGMQCLESLVFVLAAVGLGALSFFWVRRHLN
jgi:hypothetical protein